MRGLSLLQAPPFVIPFTFFATGVSFWFLSSLFAVYFSFRGGINLPFLLHSQTVLFALFVMFGALFQMLPVVVGAVIENPIPKAFIFYFPMLLGAFIFLSGFFTHKTAITKTGALLLYASVMYGALLMLFHALKVKSYIPTSRGIKFSLFFLVVGVSFGVLWLFFPYDVRIFKTHYTFMLFGWVGALIVSVSFQVIEMFFTTDAYPRIFSMNFPYMLSFSMLLAVFMDGFIFKLPLSLLFFTWSFMTLKRLYTRRRKATDYTIYFWYLGLLMLCLSLVFFLMDRFMTFLLLFVLFFSSIIAAMLYRIIPFLVWFHLSNLNPQKAPLMSDVIKPERIRVSFFLHSVFCLLCTLGLFKLASVVFVVSTLWLAYHTVRGGLLYFELT
ncbi:hypothetical protein [Thermocrinis minervae]|uniref:NnrS protein n=1 Tax=Thermocrinis minervae TaxID=381751 RepID=A0A1M6R4W4_9AQUI|nr:hypothetical protein [Thermocrinis minervae]SHK27519.1 hypothetical protein SAMN05444391_0515 [Thermocrinis minervae]